MGRKNKWIESQPGDRVESVARRALSARLELMWHYLGRSVRESSSQTENVHQLRVFSRRAGAALEIFEPCLPPRRGSWIAKQVKRVRRAAGAARDLDVLAMRWIDRELHAPTGRVDLLLDHVKQCRRESQEPIEAIREKLVRKKYKHRSDKFLERIETRASGGETELDGGDHNFGAFARRSLAELTAPYLAAAAAELTEADALHAFRIQGKKVRYAMEIFAGAFDAPFREELYKTVANLQERLGAINDHVTAQSYLEQWRAREASHGQEACAFCQAIDVELELERQAFELARSEFLNWWTADERARLQTGFSPYVTQT